MPLGRVLIGQGKKGLNLIFIMVSCICFESRTMVNLKGYEEGDGFHAVVASVHVVSHKQIVGVRRLPT